MEQLVPTYRGSRTAFDAAAATYDHEFESLNATKRIRRIIWSIYYRHFRPADSLLELNCGTGTDALELASNGMYVLATDSSVEMIGVLRRKLMGTALNAFVFPMQIPFSRLKVLYGRQFDGIYSNFGGLNCTSQLHQVAYDLAMLVKPGRSIVLCIMSNFSLWETLAFLVRGRWRKAFRRSAHDGVLAKVNGERVWVHYYSPDQVKKMFASHFDFVELHGINIFSPPPTSRTAYRLLGKFNRILEKLDEWIPANSSLHGYGDHFVIVFRRKGAE